MLYSPFAIIRQASAPPSPSSLSVFFLPLTTAAKLKQALLGDGDGDGDGDDDERRADLSEVTCSSVLRECLHPRAPVYSVESRLSVRRLPVHPFRQSLLYKPREVTLILG